MTSAGRRRGATSSVPWAPMRRNVSSGSSADVLRVRDLVDAEVLGELRRDLRRVAVDRLHAGDDEVVAAAAEQLALDPADRQGERVRGRDGVGAAHGAVREEDRLARRARDAVGQDVAGLRRAHREVDRLRRRVAGGDPPGERQRVEVERVQDAVEQPTAKRALLAVPGVLGDVADVRNLLHQDDAVHGHLPECARPGRSRRPAQPWDGGRGCRGARPSLSGAPGVGRDVFDADLRRDAAQDRGRTRRYPHPEHRKTIVHRRGPLVPRNPAPGSPGTGTRTGRDGPRVVPAAPGGPPGAAGHPHGIRLNQSAARPAPASTSTSAPAANHWVTSCSCIVTPTFDPRPS